MVPPASHPSLCVCTFLAAPTKRFCAAADASGGHTCVADAGTVAYCKAFAFHAMWLPTFNLLSTFHTLSNLTFHMAHFLSASLYASNTRYNGLHLLSGAIQRVADPS